jgi:hypothetical protein
VSSLGENDVSILSNILNNSPVKHSERIEHNTDVMDAGDEPPNQIESKIEEKIRKLERNNKTKMLEKVSEETENHNGAIVSKYVVGNNFSKSKEIRTEEIS